MHRLDEQMLAALYGGEHGAWGTAMVALTLLGSGWSALALLPLVGWRPTRRWGSALAIAIVAQASSVWALKLATSRVRPWIAMGLAPPLGAPHDGSFPSGHASGSFCVAAFIVVALQVAWPRAPWRRRFVGGLTIAVAALVAFSRVYLGAHYPSDVVGGALLGTIVGAIAAAATCRAASPLQSARG